jgi:orotate phosphoribosyltransferase
MKEFFNDPDKPTRLETWEQARKQLIDHAVATGREFTLKSGRKSDFYVDCRVASLMLYEHASFATPVSQIVTLMCSHVQGLRGIASFAPVPLGGVLMLVRASFNSPLLVPRSTQKDHGMEHKVEGLTDAPGFRLVPEGARVLLVEDVITTAGSVIAAAQALREAKLDPVAACVLVDREEGGKEALEAENIEVFAAFTQSDLR